MLWIALEGEEEEEEEEEQEGEEGEEEEEEEEQEGEEEEEDLVHTYTVHKNSHPIPLLQPLICIVCWYDILEHSCY